jgi:hypothetical protein
MSTENGTRFSRVKNASSHSAMMEISSKRNILGWISTFSGRHPGQLTAAL